MLRVNSSYEIKNISVNSFEEEKHHSWPKEGGSLVEIEDIGNVAEDHLPETTVTLCGAKVCAATLNGTMLV